jgi:hypothetical protein
VGHQSHPAELGQQPEARRAWCRATDSAKQTTASLKAVTLSPEIVITRGRPRFQSTRGPRRPSEWPGGAGPAGVRDQGEHASGFPRNLRGLPSPVANRPGRADPKTSRPSAALRRRRERTRSHGGYRRAITRAHGMEEQESERFHSTAEAGERFSTGPGGGKGSVVSSNRWRETWRRPRTLTPCQRDNNG